MASCGTSHVCFSLDMPLFRYVIAGKKGLIQNQVMTAFLCHGVCVSLKMDDESDPRNRREMTA